MGRPRRSPEALTLESVRADFWRRVAVAAPDECWAWTLRLVKGYGAWQPRGGSGHPVWDRNCAAHRLAWLFERGPIPPRWTIDHQCFNRACCNPAHLQLMTLEANSAKTTQSLRTHCPQGHPYEGDNLRIAVQSDGKHRRCRTCARELSRRRYKSRAL